MKNIIFISANNNNQLYRECILENPFVRDNPDIQAVEFDQRKDNQFISKRYNQFLDSWNYNDDAWFVFCHNDWEVLEDMRPLLENLPRDSIYGPFGNILIRRGRKFMSISCGKVNSQSRDGSEKEVLASRNFITGTPVDCLDAQCLIVHSSLVKKHELRFDENYEYDLYVEDFSAAAKENHGIQTRILNIACCHHSIVRQLGAREPAIRKMTTYFYHKYPKAAFGSVFGKIGGKTLDMPVEYIQPKTIKSRGEIYHVLPQDIMDPSRGHDCKHFAYSWIETNSKVLDVACACGDFGAACYDYKNCEMIGMEHNEESLEFARTGGKYKALHQVDLENFDTEQFKEYLGYFDYIFMGDILEHLRNPLDTIVKLKKFLNSGGSFLLSIPNIAHGSIKAQLLADHFDYMDTGLLDRTHVHFFTWRTIAEFLADANLAIESVKPTLSPLRFMLNFNPFLFLNCGARRQIRRDIHSYVFQYVIKCRPSNSFFIEQENLAKLDFNPRDYRREMRRLSRRTRVFGKMLFYRIRLWITRRKLYRDNEKYGARILCLEQKMQQ